MAAVLDLLGILDTIIHLFVCIPVQVCSYGVSFSISRLRRSRLPSLKERKKKTRRKNKTHCYEILFCCVPPVGKGKRQYQAPDVGTYFAIILFKQFTEVMFCSC